MNSCLTQIPLLARGQRQKVEPKGRLRIGHSQRGAGLGTWAAVTSYAMRDRLKAWKAQPQFNTADLDIFSQALEDLIRAWSGEVWPLSTMVTVPPQGASQGHPYAAEMIGRAVANRLGLPFRSMLARTDAKKYHGAAYSLKQAPFKCQPPDPKPEIVLVVDDFITSGTTMRLSLQAIRGAGIPAFGFAYSGHAGK